MLKALGDISVVYSATAPVPNQLGMLWQDTSAVPAVLKEAISLSPIVYQAVAGGGGSGGTVTQINQGAGIILTPSPITTTGTVAVNPAVIASLALSAHGGLADDGRDGDDAFPIQGPVGPAGVGTPGAPGAAGAAAPIIPGDDGRDGDDGAILVTMIPGYATASSLIAAMMPGDDGRDGDDAPIIQGPVGPAGVGTPGTPGAAGATGFSIPGDDGNPGDDAFIIPGPPGRPGLNAQIVPGDDGMPGDNETWFPPDIPFPALWIQPYAPGSFVIPTGFYAQMVKRLQLTTTQRAQVVGTGRLRIN